MRAALVTAWLFGMGLVTYKYVTVKHQPPIPGALLGASGFFALLALLAEYQPAAGAAAAVGWGVDIAALMGFFPESVAGPTTGKAATQNVQKPGAAGAKGKG